MRFLISPNMLRSVKIENFLSFAGEQQIPLSQQSNVLVGINGSGKTNLIRAFQLLNACAREDLYFKRFLY
jgi:AAA15 family ATPase/GTPase